ncbi:MAG: hypothetical protein K0Q59_4982 [Paenibacillus sp.]|nr:hypothetical protein [Paenibacillus sp.]
MTPSGTFWDLVVHEFKSKGNWKHQNRSGAAKWWWMIYIAFLVLAGLSVTMYFAINNTLRLEYLWFAAFGLPYIIFFVGYGNVKGEWENDTYGWWLTLPYSRHRLVAAKWLGGLIRVAIIGLGIFVLALLYSSLIAALLDGYTMGDVARFIKSGIKWLLMLGLSPLLMSFGILTACSQHTAIVPISPILWIVFMGGFGMSYSVVPSYMPMSELFANESGENWISVYPNVWAVIGTLAVGWVVAYLIIRLTGYLFERKLRL